MASSSGCCRSHLGFSGRGGGGGGHRLLESCRSRKASFWDQWPLLSPPPLTPPPLKAGVAAASAKSSNVAHLFRSHFVVPKSSWVSFLAAGFRKKSPSPFLLVSEQDNLFAFATNFTAHFASDSCCHLELKDNFQSWHFDGGVDKLRREPTRPTFSFTVKGRTPRNVTKS